MMMNNGLSQQVLHRPKAELVFRQIWVLVYRQMPGFWEFHHICEYGRLRGQLKPCPLTTAQVSLAGPRKRGLGRMSPLALGAAGKDEAAGAGRGGEG